MRRILPEDVASVEAVLAAMPEQVAGLSRLPGGPNEADYEGDALVTVMRLGTPTENMTATNALGSRPNHPTIGRRWFEPSSRPHPRTEMSVMREVERCCGRS